MITNYKTKRLRINSPLKNYPAGAEITIRTDKNGMPLDQYWRNRLNDAEKDNCVEIVRTQKKKTKNGGK